MTADSNGIRLDRIAARMQALSIDSNRELARRAGVDNVTISLLRSGQRPNVSAVMLAKIAAALRCTSSYLLGEVESVWGGGIRLPTKGEAMIMAMEQLSEAGRAELLDVAGVMVQHEARRAAWNATAAALVQALGQEEAERLLALVVEAAKTGDLSRINAEFMQRDPA